MSEMDANFAAAGALAAAAPIFTDEQVATRRRDEIRKDATRYIFYAGDCIGPRRKGDFKDGRLDAGGEEPDTICLRRTRGFLRRGRITPLEVAPAFHPLEQLQEADLREAIETVYDKQGRATLHGVPIYPGEEIHRLLYPEDSATGLRPGVVEITALAGRDWKPDPTYGDREMFALQCVFFPEYPEVPRLLRPFEQSIREGLARLKAEAEKGELTGARAAAVKIFGQKAIEKTGAEMLESCRLYRQWGLARFDLESALVRVGRHEKGMVYTYSHECEAVIEQLELQRADRVNSAAVNVEEAAQRAARAAVETLPAGQPVDMQAIAAMQQAAMDKMAETFAQTFAKTLAEEQAKFTAQLQKQQQGEGEKPKGGKDK